MVGVAIGTMALVVVLSVFNGLEDLIRSLYQSFDPELQVQPYEGKSFVRTDSLYQVVLNTEGVALVTEVIEDNAYLRYMENEAVVKVKGVSDNFLDQNRLQNSIVAGRLLLQEGNIPYAVVGRGLQYRLGISISNDFYALQLYYPKNIQAGLSDPSRLTNRKLVMPSGVFALERQYDEQYVFVPLSLAQDLMSYGDKRTSFEIKVAEGYSRNSVQKALSARLGAQFVVKNSDEQHASLLKAIRIEKLFVYLTFSFILAIASFNIFFSLTMLAIDKKKDIAVLRSMGATTSLVKKIFQFEGAIISLGGALIGLVAGLAVCFIQDRFGIISMGMESSILDAYPVKMNPLDFVFTALSVIIITWLASFNPARLASKTPMAEHL